MVKRVFSGSMVFHAWNSQNVDYGRRSDDRVKFNGRAIYSYGSHYCLGYIMPDGSALLNSKSYSVSTSKHQSETRHAVSNRATYFIRDLEDFTRYLSSPRDHVETLLRMLRQQWETVPAETATYLLGLMGKKPGFWTKEVDKLARAKAARELASKKAARQHMIVMATHAATQYTPSVLAETMAELETRHVKRQLPRLVPSLRSWDRSKTEWREERGSEALQTLLSQIMEWQKAVKGVPGKLRVHAKLQAIAKTLRTRKAALAKREGRGDELNAFIRNRGAFTHLLGKFERGELARAENVSLAGYAEWLAGFRRLNSKVLLAIAADCHNRERKARLAENAERMAREAEKRAEWLAGSGSNYGRYSDAEGRALLRVKGDTLETSWGASVPLQHALKAFPLIKLCREKGQAWKRNGHTLRVGHFQIDAIDTEGNFKAGCHNIGWNEVLRIATLLNVFETVAADTSETTHA